MSMDGQPTAFVIGEADSAVQVRAEDPVLFEQEGDCVLSLVGPPASHGHHEESKHGDVHDRGSLHYRLNGARESTSAEQWDTTRLTRPGKPLRLKRGACGFKSCPQDRSAATVASIELSLKGFAGAGFEF
jgi:hypothetical protein